MKPINKYYNLRELVADCGGIENFRFFGTLDKYDMMTPFGFALTSLSDDLVECKIEDDTSCGDLYTFALGYKVRIAPANDHRYASRLFYQSDLLSMLKEGCVLLKTSDNQHIEEKEGFEHLHGNAYVHHYWTEVVDNYISCK